MNSILKVDRITSVAEATAIVATGGTIVGISLDGNDDRRVDVATGRAIRAAITGVQLAVTLDPTQETAEAALAEALALMPNYLQVPRFGNARDAWQKPIRAAGLPLILDGEEAAFEDDPSWIMESLRIAQDWGAGLIQLDLLADMAKPWRFLHEGAHEDPAEWLQLDEIEPLTRRFPVLVGMEVDADEVAPLRSAFPQAQGVFFRLGPQGVGPVLELLRRLA